MSKVTMETTSAPQGGISKHVNEHPILTV